jgi:hypothetical protein
VQEVQLESSVKLVDAVHAWLVQHASCDNSHQDTRMPLLFVYADGIHNHDFLCSFRQVTNRLSESAHHCAAAFLEPSDFNGKQSLAGLARTILEKACPGAQIPAACSLSSVAAMLPQVPSPGARLSLCTSSDNLPFCCKCSFIF